MSVSKSYEVLRGISDPARKYLAVIAEVKTGVKPGYLIAGHGVKPIKGAWAVSVDVWGTVPDDLAGQAAQAIKIYNQQIASHITGPESASDCARALAGWHRPALLDAPPGPDSVKQCESLLAKLAGPLALLAGMGLWKWALAAVAVAGLGYLVYFLATKKSK